MSNETSKKEFEAWARSFGCSFNTTGYAPYDYCNADVQLLWKSWQASRYSALEDVAVFIESGSFFHDQSPAKLFAEQLAPRIRRMK